MCAALQSWNLLNSPPICTFVQPQRKTIVSSLNIVGYLRIPAGILHHICKKSQEDGRLDYPLAALSADKCIIGIVNISPAFTFDLITLIQTGGDHC